MNFPSQKSTSSSLSTFHGFPKVSRPLRALIEFVIRTTIDPDTLSKINRQLTKPLHLLIEPRSVKRPNIIPRPQNLFVLYRCDMQEVFLRENGESTIGNQLKEVSKWASKKWKEEPEEIRDLYQEMAKCAKKVHLMAYPNYEYKPRRKRVPFKEFYKNHQIHVHGKQKLSTILPANIITQSDFEIISEKNFSSQDSFSASHLQQRTIINRLNPTMLPNPIIPHSTINPYSKNMETILASQSACSKSPLFFLPSFKSFENNFHFPAIKESSVQLLSPKPIDLKKMDCWYDLKMQKKLNECCNL